MGKLNSDEVLMETREMWNLLKWDGEQIQLLSHAWRGKPHGKRSTCMDTFPIYTQTLGQLRRQMGSVLHQPCLSKRLAVFAPHLLLPIRAREIPAISCK
jgi:hypothetical protein